MKIWDDYRKVLSVIDSCFSSFSAITQLEGASRMLIFWLDMHMDTHVYRNTFNTYIKIKFKELNGQEFDKIPYKEVISY